MPIKLIITDLDGTLLRSDLSISNHSKETFEKCKANGILTAFATARSEAASQKYIEFMQPDIVISNGGALVRVDSETIFKRQLDADTTKGIIDMCLELTEGKGTVTVGTDNGYFFNQETKLSNDSDSKYTDFSDFNLPAYKITSELENEEWAQKIVERFPQCETLSYRDEIWRRFAAVGADKVSAIQALASHLNISMTEIAAFGDDYNDIGMLKSVGIGVAMGNAIKEAKEAASYVTGTNDNDGVAEFIDLLFSKWLFFDVGSTLIDETEAYAHRIRDAIAGTDITFEQFTEKRIEFAKQNLKGDLEAIKYFGLIRTRWHKEDERPYPDSESVLKYLSERGYKLGIIANQSLGTAERLESWGLLQYIDLVVASAEEGISKPNKKIFLRALERAKCCAENAVMIGDRLDNDIYPAKKLGMKTVWVKQDMAIYQYPENEDHEPNITIDSIAELMKIF